MTEINKNISKFIESQFPDFYQDGADITQSERSLIVDFVEAYYEFIENNRSDYFLASRDMFDNRDIDTTVDDFIRYFRTKYLNEFPVISATDERMVIKHVIDLYRAKGTEKAVKLLIRLVFNEDATIYYPAQDILKASSSTWVKPVYIEVTRSSRTESFLGKIITGSKSASTAYVESMMTKRVNGKIFDVLYLSNINGDFVTGEIITDDGNYVDSPTIIGSLSSIELTDQIGGGYSVGDILNIISNSGKFGLAKVTSIFDVSDQVKFNLIDGGFGYSLEEAEVLVSDAILFLDNSNLAFADLETVSQPLYIFDVGNTSGFSVDESIDVLDTFSNTVSSGFITDISNTNISYFKTSGSLTSTQELTLSSNALIEVGEPITAESEVELTLESTTGIFQVGEEMLQTDIADNIYTNIAYGTIVTANNTSKTYILDKSWGEFIDGKTVVGQTSGANGTIESSEVTSIGSVGTVTSVNNDIIIVESEETFSANTDIRGDYNKNRHTVVSVDIFGVASIEGTTANTNVISISDVSISGSAIGQNENIVAISGNTEPFYISNTVNTFVYTSDDSYQITRIGTGSGASFEIGSLNTETTESINIFTDIIGDSNIMGIPYLDIEIDGDESQASFISNTSIISGGSGYANGSVVTVSGGGYYGGEPIVPAEFSVMTDGSGSIIDLIIEDGGAGYESSPTISITDGTGANVEVSVSKAYGFESKPDGTLTNGTIKEMLTNKVKTIGEIKTLKSINPGTGYDTNVFTKIIERDIYPYTKYDFNMVISDRIGVFSIGEIISGETSGAKGRVEVVSENTLKIKSLSYANSFIVGETIIGSTSTASGEIASKSDIVSEDPMGFNANISSVVILNSGLIATVDIIDSGFGYISGESVSLYDSSSEISSRGITGVNTQGSAEGFWKTTESHIGKQRLHDNDFYQEYSYQVIASISLDKYEDVIRDILHVAGMKLFGKVINNSYTQTDYVMSSNVSTNDVANTYGAGGIKPVIYASFTDDTYLLE